MPIQQLVVVSDAHLGAVPPRVEEALLGFLDTVPALGDGLLVNGDLFAFWFGYRRAIPRVGLRVVARLVELSRRIPVLMIGGNHDRWGDPIWGREFDVSYADDEMLFRVGAAHVIAVHGDRVHGSGGDRVTHGLFRSRLASAVYRALPAELGFRITDRLARRAGSEPASRSDEQAAALQRRWAASRLAGTLDPTLLIMGHCHHPAAEQIGPGRRYLNPGAWFDEFRYAIATDSRMELNRFRG